MKEDAVCKFVKISSYACMSSINHTVHSSYSIQHLSSQNNNFLHFESLFANEVNTSLSVSDSGLPQSQAIFRVC
jgi:hypothetical protein